MTPFVCQQRYQHAGCVIDGQLYICGGFGNRVRLRSVERCCPTLLSGWEPLPDMRYRRSGFGALATHGFLYVCGGRRNPRRGNPSVERFTLASDAWETIDPTHQMP